MATAKKPPAAKKPAAKKPAAKKTATRTTKKTTARSKKKPGKDVINLPVLPDDEVLLERLISMVPPKEVADEYVHRTLDSGITDFAFFDFERERGKNVLMPGPTGSGKTMALRAYAAKNRIPFGWLEGSRLARIDDVFGEYLPDENDATKLVFAEGDFTLIFRYGGVYVVDEVNMILEGVSSKLFAAFDDRATIQLNNQRREKVRKNAGCLLAAAYNPGYAGGRPLNHALKRRFTSCFWDYSSEVEDSLIEGAVIREVAAKLRESVGRVITTPVPTSLLVDFEDNLYGMLTETLNFATAFSFARDVFLDSFDRDTGELPAVRDTFKLKENELRDEYAALYVAADDDTETEIVEPDDDVSGGDDGAPKGWIARKASYPQDCAACGVEVAAGEDSLMRRDDKTNKWLVAHRTCDESLMSKV